MLQTDSGFTVAVLARIVQPTASQDPTDYSGAESAMAKALQDDAAESFISGLQSRDKITVNQKLLAQIYQ